ncbi:MAG: hypothetical protein WBD27_07140 [Pyrinomonadaceae bacterium]
MKENDPTERLINRIKGWVLLGASTARLQEEGFVHADMHRGNLVITRLGYPILLDAEGVERITYPDDWHLLATALITLFSWIEDFEIAAFRFGYIQHGGPIAQLVFSSLRSLHDLNSFRNLPSYRFTVTASSDPDVTFFFSADAEWRKFRSSLPYGNVEMGSLDVQHLDQWRSERNSYETQDSVQSYQMCEYHYKKHLVAAFAERSLYHLFEAILNLQELYHMVNWKIRAVGLAVLSERLAMQYGNQISESMRSQIIELNQKVFSDLEHIKLDQLRSIKEVNEMFHWLWCIEDLEHGDLTCSGA